MYGAGGSVLPVNHRQRVDSDGGLTLSAVNRLADAGAYTCDARDTTGQGMSRSVHVSVMGSPQYSLFCSDDLTQRRVLFYRTTDNNSNIGVICDQKYLFSFI